MNFWALLLVIANLALAGFIYLSETSKPSAEPSTDLNADKMRIIRNQPESASVAKTSDDETAAPESAVCVEWSSIAGPDLERAKDQVAKLVPPEKVTENRIEEPTRFWVNIPASEHAAATVARLRAAGVKDVFLQPDTAISLGLFAKEDMAKRVLVDIHGRGFKEAKIDARSLHLKEAALIVHGADKKIADSLGEVAGKFDGSKVHQIECAAAEEKRSLVDRKRTARGGKG